MANDESIAASVVLPAAWAEGDFVRGIGQITRRLGGAVEPWSYEQAYADARRTLIFPPEAVRQFDLSHEEHRIQSIRKRVWMALPDSRALVDFDVALQLTPGGPFQNRRQSSAVALAGLTGTIGAGASLPVRLRSDELHVTRSLVTVGKPLAAHFAKETSAIRDGASMVGSGKITAVVEAPGVRVETDEDIRSEQLEGGRIHLASTNVAIQGGGSLRCHVLWSAGRSKGDRKRIRELRIHILRLHSIFELMRFLCSHAVVNSLSETRGTQAFDHLQRTLLSCVRIVRTQASPGDTAAGRVLDTAFFSENFVDRNLELMLARMLDAMRPRVRLEVEEFLESERQRAADNLAASELRERLGTGGIIVVQENYNDKSSKYSLGGSGNVFGAVGDNASVHGNVTGGAGNTLTIGGQAFVASELVAELQTLREALSSTPEAIDAMAPVQEAQDEAAKGNAVGVVAALKRAGKWALDVAERIAVPVATAAIKAAMGLP
jgi:hypothetical protein